ncbi:MAG TPA: wax ester/triacylglycerol synthase family O-acyltransferase [Rhodocyclaceae bacterium]|nr:wax ester/triacylglycerol synthase family O-acyltransferase [Rhodocyclaceae bacterium]
MPYVKHLSALDAAFFTLETAERMSNIGSLVIIKPPAQMSNGAEFAEFLLTTMKKKPVGTPFNYIYSPTNLRHMARLEAATQVDLNDHCHRLTLPAPGTDRQLFDLICRIHVQRLDRSRPLWELYVIDGLEHGRVAVYAKMHHGTIDGRGFIEVCTRWCSPDPKTTDIHALWEGLRVATTEAKPEQPLAVVLKKVAKQVVETGSSLAAMSRFVYQQALKTSGKGQGIPLPFINTPRAFKAPPSIKRSFAYCILPLADMKEFSKAQGVTVNDVLLTVVDMALNRYLHDKTGYRGRPLVVDMPISIGDSAGKGGNQVAILPFPLGREKASPIDRLRDIHQQTIELKEQIKQEVPRTLAMYTAVLHTVPAFAELFGLKNPPRLANVTISNPFGLPEKRYIAGGEIEVALPISGLLPGQSLNITATTYDKGLQISIIGLHKQAPDIQKLADYTVEAFDQLRTAFEKRVHAAPAATHTAEKTAKAKHAEDKPVKEKHSDDKPADAAHKSPAKSKASKSAHATHEDVAEPAAADATPAPAVTAETPPAAH